MAKKTKTRKIRKTRKAKITGVHYAGPNHRVLTTLKEHAETFVYRREVCAECPWRKDRPTGVFPAEAFRHSTRTCHDMAQSTFACHMSGADSPATCAGFLLSASAEHNMTVRLRLMTGAFKYDEMKPTAPTYETYAEMAIANGCDPNDPEVKACR